MLKQSAEPAWHNTLITNNGICLRSTHLKDVMTIPDHCCNIGFKTAIKSKSSVYRQPKLGAGDGGRRSIWKADIGGTKGRSIPIPCGGDVRRMKDYFHKEFLRRKNTWRRHCHWHHVFLPQPIIGRLVIRLPEPRSTMPKFTSSKDIERANFFSLCPWPLSINAQYSFRRYATFGARWETSERISCWGEESQKLKFY